MGVILNGILGGVSGRVAGVVGGRWKDKQYLRRYAMPANPNTTAQQGQRNKMKYGVAFIKATIGSVANVYVDKFQRSMSGFNYTIQQNMASWALPVVFANVKLVFGKLWAPQTVAAASNIAHISITFSGTSIGNNGATTDKIYAAAFDETLKLWYFPAAEVNRSVGTISIALSSVNETHNMHCYCWAAKRSLTSATLIEMVSDSVYATCVYSGHA